MTNPFDIQCTEWLPPFDMESAEGYTFADIKIIVNGRFATELEDFYSQSLRRGMYVSAYPLALFFAANWWRLRWEPAFFKDDPEWRIRHSLAAIGEGYAWPDISFASDGEYILVTTRGTEYSTTSPVRYIADFAKWVPADVFETTISECVEKVLARLAATNKDRTELETIWKDVCMERADTHAALWRRLEALAGYDPDEAPEAFVQELFEAGENTGWATIQELVAASRDRAIKDLKLLQDAVQECGVDFRIADFERIAADIRPSITDAAMPPWKRAYNVAKTARSNWGLDRQPLSNRQLAEVIGIKKNVLENATGPGSELKAPYSASSNSRDQKQSRLILNRKLVTSRRFSACRLIGDRFYGQEGDRISAATDTSTIRQKFQRAFAQEMLCPFDALMDFLSSDMPTDDDIEDAAYHFQVSSRLVHATLVNHHVLPRETMEEFF